MRDGKLVVDSLIADLQSGRQLRLAIDSEEASDYLACVAGVSKVEAGVRRWQVFLLA